MVNFSEDNTRFLYQKLKSFCVDCIFTLASLRNRARESCMSISMQFRRWQHVRFSNPPAIEVFNFTLLVEKKIENKSVYAKKRKRKMEEIVTYETLLFALVNFSIARLIVNLNRGANLAWISANYFLAAWPLSVIFYFFFFLFFSQRCTLRSITEQRY